MERPIEIEIQGARLGSAPPFVFATDSSVGLESQAQILLRAVDEVVKKLGGWLVHEGLATNSASGFAKLMRKRETGELPWERVCPVVSPDRRPAHKDRRPYNLLSELGYPCWVVGRFMYSVDLFNPANELMLPYTEEQLRLWQVVPFPPGRIERDTPFAAVVKGAAEALDTMYGFGGNGLTQAVFAYRFSGWASPSGWMKALDRRYRLTDLSYPYMVIRREHLKDEATEQLSAEEIEVRNTMRYKIGVFESFGPASSFVLVGLTGPGLSFPMGNDLLGTVVGKIIGKPYALDMIST